MKDFIKIQNFDDDDAHKVLFIPSSNVISIQRETHHIRGSCSGPRIIHTYTIEVKCQNDADNTLVYTTCVKPISCNIDDIDNDDDVDHVDDCGYNA